MPHLLEAQNNAIRLTQVVKRSARGVVLDEVSLYVEQGEILAIVGPSGAGKTALLDLVGGTASPDQGEVLVAGVSAAVQADEPLAVARLPSRTKAPLEATVSAAIRDATERGNLDATLDHTVAARQAGQMLALARLGDVANRRLQDLPADRLKRVELACAMAARPRVLLLDDPFAGLDRPVRRESVEHLRLMHRAMGLTTLWVTSDLDDAMSVSDQVAVMSRGRVHQVGTPADVFFRPNDPFVARFCGSSNVIPVRCTGRKADRAVLGLGQGAIEIGEPYLRDAEPGMMVDLYLRPGGLRLQAPGPHALLMGTVVRHRLRDGSVELLVDIPSLPGAEPLTVLGDSFDAIRRWPVGAPAGVDVLSQGLAAFVASRPQARNLLER